VVDTNAMPQGHFLVGAFNMAAQVFDREDANVQVSTEDGDNFVKNMVTIRAEERLALAVFRPQSFVYGAF
jgi:HK97 family phage major capsid protein